MVDIAFGVVSLLAFREYVHCLRKKANPIKWLGYLCCIAVGCIHMISDMISLNSVLKIIGMSVPAIISILFIQVIATEMKTSIKDIAITLLGICYVIGFLLYIPLLHGVENGKFLIWYIFIAAWGTDIFAYFIGMRIRKT